MRMPGMDGAQFLAAVRTVSPESIRVMLTGVSDMEIAVRAVNEGQIFRFLTKPIPGQPCSRRSRLRRTVPRGTLREQQLKVTIEALEQLDLGTLRALARAIDAKSEWTAGHSERVTIWLCAWRVTWVCQPRV